MKGHAKITMQPEAPEGTIIYEHTPLCELHLAGQQLTYGAVAWVEEMLRPLAQVVPFVDILLKRVSVQHLNEAKKNADQTLAERYNAQSRVVFRDNSDNVVFTSEWFAVAEFTPKFEYKDDTDVVVESDE